MTFAPELPLRFLLRGSALLTFTLALWWLALRPPTLFLLRLSEAAALRLVSNAGPTSPISVDDSGDWNFRVPVEDTWRDTIQKTGPMKFRAIEFTMPRADVVLFTFSLPVYWAIVLAAPLGKSGLRALLCGTALVFLIEVLSLLAQVEMMAYAILAQLHLASNAPATWSLGTSFGMWSRELGTRLIAGVIPFAAPVVAAVALNHSLRSQIFPPAPARPMKKD